MRFVNCGSKKEVRLVVRTALVPRRLRPRRARDRGKAVRRTRRSGAKFEMRAAPNADLLSMRLADVRIWPIASCPFWQQSEPSGLGLHRVRELPQDMTRFVESNVRCRHKGNVSGLSRG